MPPQSKPTTNPTSNHRFEHFVKIAHIVAKRCQANMTTFTPQCIFTTFAYLHTLDPLGWFPNIK